MTPGILDLNILSEEARREVTDFYEFVKTKYPIIVHPLSGPTDMIESMSLCS